METSTYRSTWSDMIASVNDYKNYRGTPKPLNVQASKPTNQPSNADWNAYCKAIEPSLDDTQR